MKRDEMFATLASVNYFGVLLLPKLVNIGKYA